MSTRYCKSVRKSDFNSSRFYVDLLTSGGNFVFEHGTGTGAYNTVSGTVLTNLAESETVYVRTYHNAGGSRNITADGTYLAISKLIQ